jgi:hypothetical protein
MKKSITIIIATFSWLLSASNAFGQDEQMTKRNPIVVVRPTDNWCLRNGFKQDSNTDVSVYEKVFQESELFNVVSRELNGRFEKASIDMKPLDELIKTFREEKIEQGGLESKDHHQFVSGTYDEMVSAVRPDIIVEVDWPNAPTADGSKIGFEYMTMSFRVMDGYTKDLISEKNSKTNSLPKGYNNMQTLLQNCIEINMPDIISDIKSQVDDYHLNGRPVKVRFRTVDMSFDDEFGENDDELADFISKHMRMNSVKGSSNPGQSTSNVLDFNARMPANQPDPEEWVKSFIKPVLKQLGLKGKYDRKGIGELIIIISPKTD